MPRLENWSTTSFESPYTPPERRKVRLQGIVTGHPKKADGTSIVTTSIRESVGRQVTTRSGTVYDLGEPAPEFLQWLKDNGREYDPVNPVKVIR